MNQHKPNKNVYDQGFLDGLSIGLVVGGLVCVCVSIIVRMLFF